MTATVFTTVSEAYADAVSVGICNNAAELLDKIDTLDAMMDRLNDMRTDINTIEFYREPRNTRFIQEGSWIQLDEHMPNSVNYLNDALRYLYKAQGLLKKAVEEHEDIEVQYLKTEERRYEWD